MGFIVFVIVVLHIAGILHVRTLMFRVIGFFVLWFIAYMVYFYATYTGPT